MNEYGVREVSTAGLSAADVPSPDGLLDVQGERDRDAQDPPIWQFAATFRPPAALPQALPEYVARSALSDWERSGELPEIGLDALRLALWWLHQYWRHAHTEEPWESTHPTHASFTRALVKQIHLQLYQEESWWWQPEHEPTDEERWERALARSNEGRDVAELYALAADMLSEAIERRDVGETDPLNLALITEDALTAFRLHAAWQLAHGLVAAGDGRSLEEARQLAYKGAVAAGP